MHRLAARVRASRAALPRITGAVLGNESGDLDSVACALVMARFLPEPQLPVLNFPRADLPLHTEVAYMLQRVRVDPNDVVFIDEVDLSAHQGLQLTLVDHNKLCDAQQALAPRVVRIIDHHQDSQVAYGQLASKELELVGSCSTLVARQAMARAAEDPSVEPLGPDEAELLLAAILVDTSNLDPAVGRATPADVEMVTRLKALCPQVDADTLFAAAQAAKYSLDTLTLDQLLRKDFKSSGVLGIASVPMPLEELGQRGDFQAVAADFCRQRGLEILVIMTTVTEPAFARQLALFAAPGAAPGLCQSLVACLQGSTLLLTPLSVPAVPVVAFTQGNLKATRKVVMPLLVAALESPPRS